jgi:hypothetical protein
VAAICKAEGVEFYSLKKLAWTILGLRSVEALASSKKFSKLIICKC